MKRLAGRVLFALVVAFAPLSLANELHGVVVGVIDGDTIDVLSGDKRLNRIRLAGIDAPEKGQAYGNAAKQHLSKLVFARVVVVEWRKTDRYGRLVGKVLVNGNDADLRMIEAGLAWHYKKYGREQTELDRALYADAELLARSERVGLWQDRDPIAPWDFRPSRTRSSGNIKPTGNPSALPVRLSVRQEVAALVSIG